MSHSNLWAPWRMAYLDDLGRKAEDARRSGDDRDPGDASGGSFLLDYWSRPADDEAQHVIHRDDAGMILLNRYPYASGHLLVALGDARPTLLEYGPGQRAAFWRLIELATALVHRTLRPQGVNLGINEGAAAGAGVPEHLHAHLVPRWSGDTNFITVVGEVRVIPQSLERMAGRYREGLAALRTEHPEAGRWRL